MAQKNPRPRAFVTFDQQAFDLLEETSRLTQLSVSHIVNQLMHAHVQELVEFTRWLDQQTGDARIRGAHALEQYGPNDLITEMKHLDPSYQPPKAKQYAAGAGLLSMEELDEVRAILAERKESK